MFEILSAALIYTIGVIRPDWRLDLRINKLFSDIDEQYLERALLMRDPILGWNTKRGDIQTHTNRANNLYKITIGADGARNDNNYHDEVLIATYGDSFALCDEVNDSETWQYYMEEIIHKDVKNYGVGGYGVGQTLLKLKRDFKEGRVEKITIFTIYVDDLNRVVNNYRPFLSWSTGAKLGFKPSYRYLSNNVTFIPNPWIDSIKTLEELKILATKLAATDYWASRRNLLVPEFPYMLQGIKAAQTIFQKASMIMNSGGRESIWHTKEGRNIMEYILMDFVSDTKANGSIPVILFIPNVNEHWSSGRTQPPYLEFKNYFLDKHINKVTVLDVYDAEFDESKFNIIPFKGHASAYGNQSIAKYVTARLTKIGLLP